MSFWPIRFDLKEALKNVLRLAVTLIGIWIMERQRGVATFPVRRPDVLFLVPLAITIFFKRSDKAFWFFWGAAVGGFLMHFIGR